MRITLLAVALAAGMVAPLVSPAALAQATPQATAPAAAGKAPADIPFSAAKSFMSFYTFNRVAYTSVCDKEGVDVSPFVNVFVSEHTALYAKATSILAAHGMQQAEVQARLQATLASSEPDVRQALQENAVHEHAGTTTKDGCRYLAAHGDELAKGLRLEQFHPEIVRAMNGETP